MRWSAQITSQSTVEATQFEGAMWRAHRRPRSRCAQHVLVVAPKNILLVFAPEKMLLRSEHFRPGCSDKHVWIKFPEFLSYFINLFLGHITSFFNLVLGRRPTSFFTIIVFLLL